MSDLKNRMSQEEIINHLRNALVQTQTLLALIANDPTDPANGNRVAVQFNVNKATLELTDKVCEHGSLRRKCEICERDERINELEEGIRAYKNEWELCCERERARWEMEKELNAKVKELEALERQVGDEISGREVHCIKGRVHPAEVVPNGDRCVYCDLLDARAYSEKRRESLAKALQERDEARLLAADLFNQACSRVLEDGKTVVLDDLCMSTYEYAVDYFMALGWLENLPDGRNLQTWTDAARAAGGEAPSKSVERRLKIQRRSKEVEGG